MNDQDAMQMMQRCSAEIKGLRARIEYLEPKAHAYDVLSAVVGLLPKPSQGYGEDLAWRLDKETADIQHRLMQPKPDDMVADEPVDSGKQ